MTDPIWDMPTEVARAANAFRELCETLTTGVNELMEEKRKDTTTRNSDMKTRNRLSNVEQILNMLDRTED